MWVVIWLVVALASLIAILSVPFDIVCNIEVYEKPRFRIRLKWFFGLLKKDIREKKKPTEKKKKQKPGEGRKWLWAVFNIIRIKGMFGRLRRLVKEIFRSIKIRDLRVNFKVGLDDPADTAFVVGIINFPLLFWKPSFPHEVNVRANYEGEAILEGYTYLTVRVLPIQIVVSLLRFLFSWSSVKAMRTLVVAKWKK